MKKIIMLICLLCNACVIYVYAKPHFYYGVSFECDINTFREPREKLNNQIALVGVRPAYPSADQVIIQIIEMNEEEKQKLTETEFLEQMLAQIIDPKAKMKVKEYSEPQQIEGANERLYYVDVVYKLLKMRHRIYALKKDGFMVVMQIIAYGKNFMKPYYELQDSFKFESKYSLAEFELRK